MTQYFYSFINGVFSFFSPCVIPLIPGYLSLISGISSSDILNNNSKIDRKKLVISSLFFIIGFSIVFVTFGVISSMAGNFLIKNKYLIQKFFGVLLVLIGIHISGILRFNFLEYEKRKIYKPLASSYIKSLIVGFSFALGWSPCIGPFLGNILIIASSGSVFSASVLLFVYSLGMGVWFIIASLFASSFFNFISTNRKFFFYLEKAAGFIIIIAGVLIFLNRFSIE